MESPRRMSQAVPGVGECDICFEVVPCVKVLDCGHSLCNTCASRLTITTARGAGTEVLFITCPNCRKNTEFGAIDSISTRYFGKIKCDVCLGHKDTEDIWWCPECVMTFCSKCRIKEHSDKNHRMAEWNKLDPVEFGVDYIEAVRLARQSSTLASYNRHVVRAFLAKVEESLLHRLSLGEDLDKLKENLLSHYGRKFNPAQRVMEHQMHRSSSVPGHYETGGPRVVAKLLQIAGQNVSELGIPKQSESEFQIYFSMTPEEAAKYMVSKVEFIPFEEGMLPRSRCSSASRTPQPSAPETPTGDQGDRKRSGGAGSGTKTPPRIRQPSSPTTGAAGPVLTIQNETVFEMPLMSGTVGQCEIGYEGRIVFRSEKEIVFCDVSNGTMVRQKHPIGQLFRHILTSHDSKTLYTVLQSSTKHHDWALQVTDMKKSLEAVSFTIDFDIDPEDKVLDMDVHMADANTMYEIRKCQNNVTEVWRATVVEKRSLGLKTSHKLKETSLYQKAGILLSNGQIITPKDHFLIAYDEIGKTINRYHLQTHKCIWVDSVLSSKMAAPFCIGQSYHMWVFLPTQSRLFRSNAPITAVKEPCQFKETEHPELSKNLSVLKASGINQLHAVALSHTNVIFYTFAFASV